MRRGSEAKNKSMFGKITEKHEQSLHISAIFNKCLESGGIAVLHIANSWDNSVGRRANSLAYSYNEEKSKVILFVLCGLCETNSFEVKSV